MADTRATLPPTTETTAMLPLSWKSTQLLKPRVIFSVLVALAVFLTVKAFFEPAAFLVKVSVPALNHCTLAT